MFARHVPYCGTWPSPLSRCDCPLGRSFAHAMREPLTAVRLRYMLRLVAAPCWRIARLDHPISRSAFSGRLRLAWQVTAADSEREPAAAGKGRARLSGLARHGFFRKDYMQNNRIITMSSSIPSLFASVESSWIRTHQAHCRLVLLTSGRRLSQHEARKLASVGARVESHTGHTRHACARADPRLHSLERLEISAQQ